MTWLNFFSAFLCPAEYRYGNGGGRGKGEGESKILATAERLTNVHFGGIFPTGFKTNFLII